jgi:voltage-gated potassium channel
MGSAEALERFERQTAWPMLVLSVAIIPLLLVPWLLELSPGTEAMFLGIDWIIWALFAAEYLVRLYLAPGKWLFVRSNLIDLAVVLVPFLRPLRVARSVRMLRLLRLAVLGTLFGRALKTATAVLRRANLGYTLLIVTVVTIGAGLLVAELERGSSDADIRTPAEGLWWAITTVTTVGYGDGVPVTPAGRAVAVVLMLVGVGVFGLLAAALASFLIERGPRSDQKVSTADLHEIISRLDRLERMLVAQQSTSGVEDEAPLDSPVEVADIESQ